MLVLKGFGKPKRADALCAPCTHAHVEKGFRERYWRFNFAYPKREIGIDVCDCTDFNDCNATKPTKIAGFVYLIDEEVRA